MDQAAQSQDDVDPASSNGAAQHGETSKQAPSDDAEQTGTRVAPHNVFSTFGQPPDGQYEVGHLMVAPDGQVNVAYPGSAAVGFDFAYCGIPFHAELPSDLAAPLTVSAVLGVLPYSAETVVGRRATLQLLSLATPARGTLGLSTGGRILARFSAPVPRPRTPVSVVATISCLLVDLRPYLDLLAATGALRRRDAPS